MLFCFSCKSRLSTLLTGVCLLLRVATCDVFQVKKSQMNSLKLQSTTFAKCGKTCRDKRKHVFLHTGDVGHTPVDRWPLLSSGPTVTVPAAGHHQHGQFPVVLLSDRSTCVSNHLSKCNVWELNLLSFCC